MLWVIPGHTIFEDSQRAVTGQFSETFGKIKINFNLRKIHTGEPLPYLMGNHL